MPQKPLKTFVNTVLWGLALWLFGYILGIIFFYFVPKDQIGWYILPLGTAFALWVLIKRIKREEFGCYFGLGLIWTLLAVGLDYAFIVKMLKSIGYYKTDVYVYYALTFLLPLAVGWYRFKYRKTLQTPQQGDVSN